MNTKKIVVFAAIALAFLLIVPAVPAHAHGCCGNPLWLPFAVVGAAIGTAAAIASAPFRPYYYGPAYGPVYAPPPPAPVYYNPPGPPPYYHRAWIPGHYARYGGWIPGHWVYR